MSERSPLSPLHRRPISRRETLRWLGGALAVAPLSSLVGCEPAVTTLGDPAAGAGGSVAGTAGGSAGESGAQAGAAGGGSGADGLTAGGWAIGGTAAMTALASYPNPFETDDDAACAPMCQLVLGPCHDDSAPEREDISEGQGGLPMRFGLRLLDDMCQPVTDADVDIWHCDVRGIYSSETSDNPDFCTGDAAAARAARFFRGHRMTDAQGIAWFNTCFPGWYRGRAIHVHFTVRRSSRAGSEYLTSQVSFPTDLITELCLSHPDYSAHGLPDTANTADSVFPSDSVDDYLLATQRMSDGALLAWRTVIIRSSLADSICGNVTMGGPGGMPPGGAMMPPMGDGAAGSAG